MHILLASISAATSPTGVCRHAANIARGLLAFSSVQQVSMFVGAWQADYFRYAFHLENRRLNIIPVGIDNSSFARNLWYLRRLPGAARDVDADLVHLAYPVPVVRLSVPMVVSLHDLYPFDMTQNFGRRAWLNRAALRFCLRNVDAIASVSEQTNARARELFPEMVANKSAVVPNSIFLTHTLDHPALPSGLEDCPFVLCVAQHRANKNLELLIRSFQVALGRGLLAPRSKLVVVGIEGPETPRLLHLVRAFHLDQQVMFLRGLSDAQLSSLYALCEVVIAPSLLEGFGLPVAEALCAGSRVVCSDIPAFRAFHDHRCVFFNALDTTGESLLAALRQAMQLPAGTNGHRAGPYPQQSAAQYLDLYASLLRPRKASILEPAQG